MAAVEAMEAGCIPIVINKGGLKEIVFQGKDGFLWETEEELKKMTLRLIKSPKKIVEMRGQVIKSACRFDKASFCRKVYEIF